MKQQLTPRINRNEVNLALDSGSEIWPEGTSRSVATGIQLYGSVMTRLANVASSVTLTNSQSSNLPSGANIPFSNQVSKTGAGTLAAGTNINLSTFVEGYDARRILTNNFSVIFWVKSSVASLRSVALLNSSTSHTYIKQYTIAAANTWQLVALNFPALNSCPGTIETTNLAGVQVATTVVAGSTFQTATTNAWVAGSFRSGIGEDTTWLTGTTHDFSIAGMTILPGDWSSLSSNTSAYSFIRRGRDIQEEITKTQRYVEKSYDEGTDPGANTVVGAFVYTNGTATNTGVTDRFKVVKRSIPTVFYWDAVGNSSRVSFYNAAAARTDNQVLVSPTYDTSTKGISWRYSTSLATSVAILQQWLADSRY